MLAALRRARYGYLLALHIVLLCAAGHSPTEIAVVLFCSRSSVYRTVRGYYERALGLEHDDHGQLAPPVRTTVLRPTLRRSLVALLKATPQASGWCRTRWSCATLALTLQTKRGITVSAETMRRWLHELGWVWKRAKLVAKDDDPQRVNRLARIRWVFEQLKRGEAMVFADELDIHLLPKVGCAWMPKGTQLAIMTPGHSIWPPVRCSTAWERAKPTRCSETCSRSWRPAIPPSGTPGSMWSWITIRSIRRKPWSSGWPATRG
jgi:transposase